MVQRLALILTALLLLEIRTAAEPRVEVVAKSRALVVIGLPGDGEHEMLFADTGQKWRDWLTGALDFEVTLLFGRSGKPPLTNTAATSAAIESAIADLKKSLRNDDRLWVFFLGHGDDNGERASFHLPGRDLHDDDLAKLFAGIACKEQVFWLTHSASHRFLKSLSAKGRIVIAAAGDEEPNETEFPQALATVFGKLRANDGEKMSILDLYRRAVAEVEARFAADKRVPTEHAQLDDNGDGSGTEQPVVEPAGDKKPTADGPLAARTLLPFRKMKKSSTTDNTDNTNKEIQSTFFYPCYPCYPWLKMVWITHPESYATTHRCC